MGGHGCACDPFSAAAEEAKRPAEDVWNYNAPAELPEPARDRAGPQGSGAPRVTGVLPHARNLETGTSFAVAQRMWPWTKWRPLSGRGDRTAVACRPIEEACLNLMLILDNGQSMAGGGSGIPAFTESPCPGGASRAIRSARGRAMPVSIVHLLPQWLWGRCGMSPQKARPRVPNALVPTVRWACEFADAWLSRGSKVPWETVPVLELRPRTLGWWAGLTTGENAAVEGTGVLTIERTSRSDSGARPVTLRSSERVHRFRSVASPPTLRLAQLLEAVPVRLEVAKLTGKEFVPEAGLEHLAELLFSGLMYSSDSGKRRPLGTQVGSPLFPRQSGNCCSAARAVGNGQGRPSGRHPFRWPDSAARSPPRRHCRPERHTGSGAHPRVVGRCRTGKCGHVRAVRTVLVPGRPAAERGTRPRCIRIRINQGCEPKDA